MAWSGSGLFNRLYSWANDALNGLNISSSRMDAEFDNYKTGLENVVTRDGQNQASANLPMATFRHTTVGTASARDHYAQVGQIQDTGYVYGGVTGGSANALTISLTPAVTALVAGQAVRFVTGGSANSGAATLAVNGLTATALVKDGNTALVAGDLPANSLIEVVYNGTNYRLNRTSATSLLDVLHTTGPESKAGLLTLTGNLKLSNSGPFIDFRETGATLPAGLWEIQATTSTLRLYRNTAAAGDFSSFTNPIIFGADDTITVVGKIVGIDGTAATHLVTKAQLDAKVYGGQVNSAGTAVYLPSGWSSSRASIGAYLITHNLGTTSYAPVVSAISSPNAAVVGVISANTVSVGVYTSTTGALVDAAFTFTLARN